MHGCAGWCWHGRQPGRGMRRHAACCSLHAPNPVSPPALPPSLPAQAADPDVEAVVLHASPEGGVAPAHICRGAGSFDALLRSLGEPPAEGEAAPAAPDAPAERPQEQEELPKAATVS